MIGDTVAIGMGCSAWNRYEQIVFLSKILTPRRHEAEKPVELLRDPLRLCAKPGDVGLDPFAGSHNFITTQGIAVPHALRVIRGAGVMPLLQPELEAVLATPVGPF